MSDDSASAEEAPTMTSYAEGGSTELAETVMALAENDGGGDAPPPARAGMDRYQRRRVLGEGPAEDRSRGVADRQR